MKYLSTEMVADRLSMSPKQIRRYLKSGKLPSLKIGKLRRISEADLETFIDERKQRGDDWQSRKALSVA
jgi:excisionase family DNA binding protein